MGSVCLMLEFNTFSQNLEIQTTKQMFVYYSFIKINLIWYMTSQTSCFSVFLSSV